MCSSAFSLLEVDVNFQKYLESEAFQLDKTETEAIARVKFLVENGPMSVKRILKNVSHFMVCYSLSCLMVCLNRIS